MKRSNADDCIYIGRRDQHYICLALYVDDGIVISDSMEILTEILNDLKAAFEVKIKEPRFFVGFEIERDRERRTIKLYQHSHITKIIDRFRIEDAKPSSIPVDPTIKLSKDMCPHNNEEKEEMRHKPFNELMGFLQFAANMTRPDISFGVNLLSRFKENPGLQHWKAAKQIVRYLKGTIEQGIIYNGSKDDEETLIGYSDADWAGDQDDRKSMSDYIMTMCGGPVT